MQDFTGEGCASDLWEQSFCVSKLRGPFWKTGAQAPQSPTQLLTANGALSCTNYISLQQIDSDVVF